MAILTPSTAQEWGAIRMMYRLLGRRPLATLALLTALGMLLSACGPGTNPSSKPAQSKRTETKPAAIGNSP